MRPDTSRAKAREKKIAQIRKAIQKLPKRGMLFTEFANKLGMDRHDLYYYISGSGSRGGWLRDMLIRRSGPGIAPTCTSTSANTIDLARFGEPNLNDLGLALCES